ncbi:MAG TPA: Hsp20/alpha crystallin family protein [Kiritimatiellae bacterium]|nr:Hsp20/alpha crystallin family protein [Kiritimatiellia bacterium]
MAVSNRAVWLVVALLVILLAVQSWTILRLQSALAHHGGSAAASESQTGVSVSPEAEAPGDTRQGATRPAPGSGWWPKALESPWLDEQWDPFAELQRLQREIDSVFRDMFNRWWFRRPPQMPHRSLPTFSPRIDVREERDRYVVTVDIPGVDKSDIKVELSDRTLTISGSRKSTKKSQGRNFLRMEREYGRFTRQILLPGPVDPRGMEANYTNGVLTIVVPKAAQPSPTRRIPVV